MSPRRGDGGESLIEILIAIVILGLAIAALTTGLAASSRSSGLHGDQVAAHTHLLRAAEALKAAAYNSSCAPEAAYTDVVTKPPASPVVPTGWTSTVTVDYWIAAQQKFLPDNATYPNSCVDGDATLSTSLKAQRVTIRLTSPSGAVSDALSFVKRAA